jgi:hypothetical protein
MTALESTTTSATPDDGTLWISTTPDMEVSMRKLGEAGYGVIVRYDPWREENVWTVIIGWGVLSERQDTDVPNMVLAAFWTEHLMRTKERACGQENNHD